MSVPSWAEPPPALTLEPGAAHVWLADLDVLSADPLAGAGILSPDELARAARYVRPADRARFIAGRFVLRTLLGLYTTSAPRDLAFGYTPAGKPFLPRAGEPAAGLEFNLSHSGSLALFAFCRHTPVGIDLELIRPTRDPELLARAALSAREYSHFLGCPEDERLSLFYRYWTCKEACIKATGGSLDGMRHLEIDLARGAASPAGDAAPHTSFTLHEIPALPGYAAALAATAALTTISHLRYPAPRGSRA